MRRRFLIDNPICLHREQDCLSCFSCRFFRPQFHHCTISWSNSSGVMHRGCEHSTSLFSISFFILSAATTQILQHTPIPSTQIGLYFFCLQIMVLPLTFLQTFFELSYLSAYFDSTCTMLPNGSLLLLVFNIIVCPRAVIIKVTAHRNASHARVVVLRSCMTQSMQRLGISQKKNDEVEMLEKANEDNKRTMHTLILHQRWVDSRGRCQGSFPISTPSRTSPFRDMIIYFCTNS